MNFLLLIFAHLLADYPLQGDFLAKMKGERLLLLLTHCGIWTGSISVAMHCAAMPVNGVRVVALFAVHFIADFAKAHGWYGKLDPLGAALWIDQAIHLLQILTIPLLY